MASSPEICPSSGGSQSHPNANLAAEVAGSAGNLVARPKVLVADDDPIGLTLLSTLLTKSGYDVHTATNGEDALRILQSNDGPNLAVLDWMMDGTDGIEVCQRIRAIQDSSYVYIILVTSRDQQSDRIEGLFAGADDYLTKPF